MSYQQSILKYVVNTHLRYFNEDLDIECQRPCWLGLARRHNMYCLGHSVWAVHVHQQQKVVCKNEVNAGDIIKRVKHFNVLSPMFRYGTGTSDKLQKVGDTFDAIAVLTQYGVEHGHPLFKM